ncbi:hypothetical protein [Streptomyces profundus]|uniref:hypothetical protein n=1 Tax=Streptomyces profundus TaxID=2867410 RepID=UPI001D16DBAE|nr:hypothetical protein [Streptomyces sp. MA3_2.13]UED83874.1 hypothetical protein K4G22_06315 [Streptomyces sp. MA3_2.13]
MAPQTRVIVLVITRNGYVLLHRDQLPQATVPNHGNLALTGRLTLARQTGHLADITHAWTVRSIGPDNDGELWILDGGVHDTVPDATEDTHPHARWAPITTLGENQAIQEALDAADANISIQLPTT